MRVVAGRLVLVVLFACAVLAAPARAADPAQTLTAISGAYDVAAGKVSATATLAAPPSPAQDAGLVVYVGIRDADGACDGKVVMVVLTGSADASGSWGLIGSDEPGQPTDPRTVSGNTVGVSVTAPALANQGYTCIWARTVDTTNTDNEYSRITGVDLAVTAPPPPPPPPAPTPEPTPQPVPVPQAAKLALTVTGVKPMKRNRWLPVRVQVANVGKTAARKVMLRAKPARGAKASKRRIRVGTIQPGKARTVKLKLRTKRKASVALTASSGRIQARERVPLVLRGRAVKPPASGLGGTYFTLWTADPMGPGRREAYAFVDDRWAYRGIPKGGLPTCTTTTAGVDEDGDPTDGCLPYTYNRKTGALKIGDQAATLSADGAELKVGEDSFWLTPIVKPGTKLAVSLKSIWVGGYWPYQVVSTYWLEMTADGQFMLSSQTLGSWGLPGGPGSGNFASIPPDQHGTYVVLPRGKLRLTFADGTVEDRTIGIYRDAETGSADPAKDGLWLDDDPFWKDDED